MKTDLRKWLAVGTGVGIEITAGELQVTIARVRPSGVAMLGSATVDDFRQRPASEWGSELHSFLKKLGCGHIAVNVLLPRRDVIVRQIHMPGVSDRDLTAAIQLQIDSLHPFSEEDAAYSWARIGKSAYVLVGITRREVIAQYSTMFAEAGIKVASFTFSAAVLHSAIRLFGAPPRGFIAMHESAGEIEVYGESETRPVFSATFDRTPERAVALAASELRLPADIEPVQMEDLLPKPTAFTESHDPAGPGFGRHALPYAAAVLAPARGSQCPRTCCRLSSARPARASPDPHHRARQYSGNAADCHHRARVL
jgi:Tfp pilus assembly protein, ATPase PilM